MGKKGDQDRKSIRLQDYDYSSAGYYFVTIVSHKRMNIFGQINNGEIILNRVGQIIQQTWLDIPKHFPNASCDIYVIMPNHIHGIIELIDDPYINHIYNITEMVNERSVGATHESPLPVTRSGPRPKTIGAIIGLFKATVTKQYHETGELTYKKIWQRNYYEHIIRDKRDYEKIYEYIESNPINWSLDEENPERSTMCRDQLT